MRPNIDIRMAATVDKARARWTTVGLGWAQKDMEKMGRAEGKLCHPTMIVSEDRPDASRNVQNRGATTNSQWHGMAIAMAARIVQVRAFASGSSKQSF